MTCWGQRNRVYPRAMALPWHGLRAALPLGMEAEPPGERYLAEPSNEINQRGGMQATRFLGWVSRNRVFGAIWREKEPIGATRFLGWGDGGAVLTLRLWMNDGI